MILDQKRAATLVGVDRWRIVYHHRQGNGQSLDRAETVAWFHTSDKAAWASAAALLPPTGYPQPHTVTVERGTFTRVPEGGYGWQHIGPTRLARVDHTGLVPQDNDPTENGPATTQHPAALTTAGQQQLF